MRYVIFGGEALNFSALNPWIHRHGTFQPQINRYVWITETTVHVTYYKVDADALKAYYGSVIGKPLPDLSIYVLSIYGLLPIEA